MISIQFSLTIINKDYLFEVNTKYISSSVLKPSEFSRLRSTIENQSRLSIDLLFTEIKVLFIFETIMACTIPIHVTRIDGENAKSKINHIL